MLSLIYNNYKILASSTDLSRFKVTYNLKLEPCLGFRLVLLVFALIFTPTQEGFVKGVLDCWCRVLDRALPCVWVFVSENEGQDLFLRLDDGLGELLGVHTLHIVLKHLHFLLF